MRARAGVGFIHRQGCQARIQRQVVFGGANPRCDTHQSRRAHLHPARVERLRKPHVRNGTGAASNGALRSLTLRLHSLFSMNGRLGDTDRASQGISGTSGETGKVRQQGIGRWETIDKTDQGQRETVEPVTHTGTSEGTGNRIRADEREWIQPVP